MKPTEFMARLEKAFGEKAPDFETAAAAFMFEENAYWVGKDYKTGEPYDLTPDGFKGISFKLVDSYGGEDQGSDYYTVYKFTDNDTGEEVYAKFQGWYQSYDGAEYESWSFVQPKEKTVIVYE
jgi:hypothetical protein